MTTIAWDGKTLATESAMTCGDTLYGNACQKIFKLKDGSHVAFSGRVDLWREAVKWLNGGEKPVVTEGDAILGLVVDKKGNAYEFDEKFRPMPTCTPWAGGSGSAFALAALHLGKTAEEAVELACKLDVNSHLPIQKVSIRGTR
jgi:hypothetical protein